MTTKPPPELAGLIQRKGAPRPAEAPQRGATAAGEQAVQPPAPDPRQRTAEGQERAPRPEPEAPPRDRLAKRGQTLRLDPEAWRAWKALAIERGQPSHELLIEAVNDLFTKYGKPPIAK